MDRRVFHPASGCHVGSVFERDSDRVRGEILKLKTKMIFGDFAADDRSYQTGYKAVTVQWQDGRSVVVWPDEVATAKPRFPTPPW